MHRGSCHFIFSVLIFIITTFALQNSYSQDNLPAEVKIPLHFQKGWNLFSVPVAPPNFDIETFFQGKTMSPLWTFRSARFQTSQTIKPGTAYWVHLNDNLSIVYSYFPREQAISSQSNFEIGWNLCGVQSPITISSGALGRMWHYSNSQMHPIATLDDLLPGIGYWKYLSTEIDCTVGSLTSDIDIDGMADYWEALWGLDYKDATDADIDSDDDGLNSITEYITGTIVNNPDTDNDGILDGLDSNPLLPDGTEPEVVIISPVNGDTLVEGQTILFSIDATDDGLLTQVTLLTDTGFVKQLTTPSFRENFVLPLGITSITFNATASDSAGNIGNADPVTVNVIPDPLTTVVGMVAGPNGNPVEGVLISTNGISGFTLMNGSFTLMNVPTINGDTKVAATFDTGNEILSGLSESQPSNVGGVTDVGEIVIRPANELYSETRISVGDFIRPISVAIADVNGDGRPDIVTANSFSDNVSILLGRSDGSFALLFKGFFGIFSPRSVTIADMNGDARLDLVIASSGFNAAAVLLGNGDGTFKDPGLWPASSRPVSAAIADVNGDGRPDIVTANIASDVVSVLLGNGDQTFQAQKQFAVGEDPHSVAIADVNADGRFDLAIANAESNDVSILLGNGDGTFISQSRFSVGRRPESVTIADVNGDGRPDLATANFGLEFSFTDVSVLLGNGDGTFQEQKRFAVGDGPRSVVVADVNEDGRPDIVTNDYRDAVSVLLGNGDGTFLPQFRIAVGTAPNSVAIADMNGDGRLDIVTANRESDDVSVLIHN